MRGYDVIESPGAPIKAWTRGVPIEDAALKQLKNVASLPFIHSHIAVMPDVHFGIGATVGSVIPTKGAVIGFLWWHGIGAFKAERRAVDDKS